MRPRDTRTAAQRTALVDVMATRYINGCASKGFQASLCSLATTNYAERVLSC